MNVSPFIPPGKRRKKILDLITAHWRRLVIASICMIIFGVSTAATAYLVKPVIDDIFMNKDQQMLLWLPLMAVLIFFLKGVGAYGQEYLMNYVGERIIQQYRNSLYKKIMDLPVSFMHQKRTGVLMSRITNDVNIVKGMVSTAVTNVVRDVGTVICLTFVIFYQDWKLACGAFLLLPIAFYPIVMFGRRVRKFSTGSQETMAGLTSFLHETFTGSKIIKVFNLEAFEKERFQRKTQELFSFEMKKIKAVALSSPVMEFLGGLAIAFVIWFGGMRVINGVSTPGTFFSFLAAVMMLYDPVKKLSRLNNIIQEGLAATSRIYDVLEESDVIPEKEHPVMLPATSSEVVFENVSFRYSEGDEPVLTDINLKVSGGEVLAVVGMSGGGKTSLVNLIPRLYDTTGGSVRVGGYDVRDLSIASLRKNVSIVTQEPILFNETVRDNIRYGRMDATTEQITAAAKAAYAYDFIQGFPKGFDTLIGELGSRLSGGEKQRICIARALIRDAPILILDEATSALDAQAELIVQKALRNLMAGRTTFVIAHRLSTIEYAHRVILLRNGRIIEQGTHEDLMAAKGEYYQLQRMQGQGTGMGYSGTHPDRGENQ